jgi:hypothetical protein
LPDGTRVLVLPHGGRILGLFTPQNEENFYWTHPALNSVKTARAFYASDAWHNSGGDRTWIAPEVDVFLPEFPKLDKFWQPRSLDPGCYRIVSNGAGFKLENQLTIRLSRLSTNVRLKITKSFGPACNPLRHERGLDLRTTEYAGYTQHTSLEISGPNRASKAQVGLWNLIQMPHGGDLLIPTFSRNKPLHIFSTIGRIPASDIIVGERLVRYRMRQKGEHKISLRAATITGRVGYIYRKGHNWSLVIRNFGVNPSGEYVDVPWRDPDWHGFAVQACNVNSSLGAFSELEYHTPGIGHGTGSMRCDDTAQVWAFRGTRSRIIRIAQLLVTGREFSL